METTRVYAMIGGDTETPEARAQRDLIRIIRDHGGEITVRGLQRASRQYRDSAEEAEMALDRLIANGVAEMEIDNHNGGQGRPVSVYRLLESGDGNRNSEIREETVIVSPALRE